MESINRKTSLTLPLSKTAKDFGYSLEVDSHEDVFHNGYSKKDIAQMNLSLPSKVENVDLVFPSLVAHALEDGERDAYAEAIRKERIEAFKDCLEKIDVGASAEYQDGNGNMVSAKAGILSVEIKEDSDEVIVEILNPEHLINTMISGMGYIAVDLSSTEPSSNEEIIARFHNLKDYFKIYGESQPSGELSSQFSPSVSDSFLEEDIIARIQELTLEDVAEAVKECIEESEDNLSVALEVCKKHTSYSDKEIKKSILKTVQDQANHWKDILK